ncbi:universal stress protein [Actinoplanes solisilvae]|uniref:universal stress protein n=1 Tax=Actinoplanes solisilvae TaxID=2486853 RepID=UPI0013E2A1A6|nr:universal stress protein [Actinoplanes solisilvae]
MTDLDRLRAERDAVRGCTTRGRPTRYSDVIDRYLDVAGYGAEHAVGPALDPPPPATVTRTGLVVVGVDDSATSYVAVDHAAIEAELRGWHLRLVHARHSGDVHASVRMVDSRLLERLIDRVHACSGSVPVTSRLIVGPAANALLTEGRDAGLIVVGHRHGPVGAAFGRTVGDRVAARHTGAVLLVRIPGWPARPGFDARPVVAGVGGPDSDRVVAFAHGEAKLRGCELVLLHASRTPRVERQETSDGVTTHWRFVAEDPAEALIEASGQAAAVVVGRRGGGLREAGLLGSVSRSVVQHADCPVFLVD